MSTRILVWDLPLRIYHAVLAASFAGALATADSERWRDVHVLCGVTLAGAIGFRLAWGLVGTRHARFAALRHGPAAILRHLVSLLRGRPERHAGHGPVGAVAVPLLLGLGLATAASGWALYQEWGGEWVEEAHEVAAAVMLGFVCLHVAGVIAASVLGGENLVLAMITGRKRGDPREAIAGPRRLVALLLVAAILALWMPALADRGRTPAGERPSRAQDAD